MQYNGVLYLLNDGLILNDTNADFSGISISKGLDMGQYFNSVSTSSIEIALSWENFPLLSEMLLNGSLSSEMMTITLFTDETPIFNGRCVSRSFDTNMLYLSFQRELDEGNIIKSHFFSDQIGYIGQPGMAGLALPIIFGSPGGSTLIWKGDQYETVLFAGYSCLNPGIYNDGTVDINAVVISDIGAKLIESTTDSTIKYYMSSEDKDYKAIIRNSKVFISTQSDGNDRGISYWAFNPTDINTDPDITSGTVDILPGAKKIYVDLVAAAGTIVSDEEANNWTYFAIWDDSVGHTNSELSDVMLYLAQNSSYVFDYDKTAAQASKLEKYKIDTAVTEDTSPSDWFNEKLSEVFNISLINGPNGFYPYLLDPFLVGGKAVHFSEYEIPFDFSGKITQNNTEVYNKIKLKYCFDAMSSSFIKNIELNKDNNYFMSIADASINNRAYGKDKWTKPVERILEIETDVVKDDNTAHQLILAKAAMHFSRWDTLSITVAIDAFPSHVEQGQYCQIDLPEYLINDRKALITGITYQIDRVIVDIAIPPAVLIQGT